MLPTAHRACLTQLIGLPHRVLPLILLAGCTLATDTTIRAGLGKPCVSNDDCAGAICQKGAVLTEPEAGVCSLACSSNADCLDGTICAAQYCHVPLTVGLTVPLNPVPSDAWSLTFADGVTKAAAELPYIKLDRMFVPTPLANSLDSMRALAMRNRVLLGHQLEYLPNLTILATENPLHVFLGVSSANPYTLPDSPTNLGQVYLHTEEAYYIAGRLAAKSSAKRLGVIAGVIGPESIRNVNAFALGARQEKPGIVVEVRHLGYYYDSGAAPTYSYAGSMYYREEYLARLLWEAGAEVVLDMSHRNDRARKLLHVHDAMRPVLSIISHVPFGTGDLDPSVEKSVLAGILENWMPVSLQVLEQIHRGRLSPATRVGFDLSEGDKPPFTVSVNRNARTGLDRDDDAVFFIRELANSRDPAWLKIWTGPFKTNGQRDQDGNGIPDQAQDVSASSGLGVEEISKMCFFVDGVVEKKALNDPLSGDQPALVPGGLVPLSTSAESAVPAVSDTVDKLVLPLGQSSNCRKNARWIFRSNG